MVHMSLAEIVIAIRTWAVWKRQKFVGVILGVTLITGLLWSCITAPKFYKAIEYSPPPYPGYRGCFITKAPTQNLWTNYLFLTVIDSIVLIFMVISAIIHYRYGSNSTLSKVIHRDGIMLYVYLCCIAAASVAVTLLAPTDLRFMLDPFLDSLYPVFVSRIILNIRQAANLGIQTELHTSHHEPIVFAVPPQVVSDERSLDTSA